MRAASGLGGAGLELNVSKGAAQEAEAADSDISELNAAKILNFLRERFSHDKRATFDEIRKECGIDLARDKDTLIIVSRHRKLRRSVNDAGAQTLQFSEKYAISSYSELLDVLEHENDAYVGIPFNEVKSCYRGIERDVDRCIREGTIIACRNTDSKDRILFPRSNPFMAPLSGTVTAYSKRNTLKTSASLVGEVRRGDAVMVRRAGVREDFWFRVSSSTKSNSAMEPLRSAPPLSVSSEKEMSVHNVYVEKFDESHLPLDEAFGGAEECSGTAFKHGCTNDVRRLWAESLDGMRHAYDDASVERELIAAGLIAPPERPMVGDATRPAAKSEPKQKRMRISKNVHNTHLQGTEYGAILEEENARILSAANTKK